MRRQVLAEGVVGIDHVGIAELLVFHILAQHHQRLYLNLLASVIE